MRAKVPACVADRWREAKRLRKLADSIEDQCVDTYWGWEVSQYEGEDKAVPHGNFTYVEPFKEELYELVKKMRTHARTLEGCEPCS